MKIPFFQRYQKQIFKTKRSALPPLVVHLCPPTSTLDIDALMCFVVVRSKSRTKWLRRSPPCRTLWTSSSRSSTTTLLLVILRGEIVIRTKSDNKRRGNYGFWCPSLVLITMVKRNTSSSAHSFWLVAAAALRQRCARNKKKKKRKEKKKNKHTWYGSKCTCVRTYVRVLTYVLEAPSVVLGRHCYVLGMCQIIRQLADTLLRFAVCHVCHVA